MGMDTEPFSRAITKARAEMANFAEHTSEHFDRAATSGRALHGILEKIGAISPALGIGIAAAFSGPLAALELFRMGLEKIKDHYANIAKEAKEAAEADKRLRESRGDTREGERDIRKTIAEREIEGQPVSQADRDRLDAMDKNKRDIAQKTEELKQAEALQQKFLEARRGAGTASAFREAETQFQIQSAAVRDLDVQLNHLKETKLDLELEDKRAQKETKDRVEAENKQAEESERLFERNADRKIAARKKEAEIIDYLNDVEDKAASESARRQEELDQLSKRKRDQINSPFTVPISELAKSRGPFSGLASAIQRAEHFGRQANIAGRQDLVEAARRELEGFDFDPDASRAAGGISQRDITGALLPLKAHHKGLRDQLRDTGTLFQDNGVQGLNEKLNQLLQAATRDGFVLKLPD